MRLGLRLQITALGLERRGEERKSALTLPSPPGEGSARETREKTPKDVTTDFTDEHG